MPPHLAHADDKALHIDAVLGTLQRGQHIGKHTLAIGVVFHRCVPAQRRGGVVVQIARCLGRAGVLLPQGGHSGRVLAPGVGHGGLGAFQPVAQAQRRALVAPQQVEQPALYRHKHKNDHPADFKLRRGGILPDKRQAHNDAERQPHAVEPSRIGVEPVEHREQPEHLQQHQCYRDDQAAEHQVQHPAQHQPPIPFFHKHTSIAKKAAPIPQGDGIRPCIQNFLQTVNGSHAVRHRQKRHGAVGADKPALIPITDDFADKFAVVLSLDINSIGHALSLPDIVVWAGRMCHIMASRTAAVPQLCHKIRPGARYFSP